jgi:site-specific DNA-methyltransferase (adenine-specific)
MNPTTETLTLESPEQAGNVPSGGVGSTALLGSVTLSCEDCMALMRRYPDKHFDLAIVDPPYGLGSDAHTRPATKSGKNAKGFTTNRNPYQVKAWDNATPLPQYWAELFRVSRNQIVWGGNYFPLPLSRGWIYWDKKLTSPCENYSDGELAWSSFDCVLRKFTCDWIGFGYLNGAEAGTRIHPTQKPVALYRWLLDRYAKPGQRVLDTHLGSGSHAIACHYAGMHLTACEIDPDYFAAAQERIARETRQTTLF